MTDLPYIQVVEDPELDFELAVEQMVGAMWKKWQNAKPLTTEQATIVTQAFDRLNRKDDSVAKSKGPAAKAAKKQAVQPRSKADKTPGYMKPGKSGTMPGGKKGC